MKYILMHRKTEVAEVEISEKRSRITEIEKTV